MNVSPPRSALGIYLSNATSSVVTRVLQAVVLLWVNQHLLRRIDPSEYALFPLVVSLIFFAELLKNMVASGIGRFLVEADARNDTNRMVQIVSSMAPVAALSSLVIFAVGGWTISNLGSLLAISGALLPQAKMMLLLLVITICVDVAAAPFSEGAYVRQRFVALNALELSCEVLRAGLLLALILGVSASVLWMVVASAASSVVNAIGRVVLTRRWVPAIRWERGAFAWPVARQILGFSAWTGVQGITGMVSSMAPALLLNRFSSPLALAAFHLGRLPEMHVRSLAAVVSNPARPALTKLYAQGESDALRILYYRGGRYFLWLTLLPVVPLIAFAPEVIRLYAGDRYESAVGVMIALLGAYPFLWASAMFFQIAHAMGRIRAYYVCDTVVQIVTLGAMFVTVGVLKWGAFGAALAIGGVGALLHVCLIWPMGLRLVKGVWPTFLRESVLRGCVPAAVSLLAAMPLRAAMELDTWWSVGLASAVVCVVYFGVVIACCMDEYDRSLISRLICRLRRGGMPVSTVRA